MSKAKSLATPSKSQEATKENAKPRIQPDVLARKNADGTVAVMRLDNDECFFTIDGIAADVWLLIDGKSTLSSIKERLIKKHSVPVQRFEKDFANFIKQLKKEKLIEL